MAFASAPIRYVVPDATAWLAPTASVRPPTVAVENDGAAVMEAGRRVVDLEPHPIGSDADGLSIGNDRGRNGSGTNGVGGTGEDYRFDPTARVIPPAVTVENEGAAAETSAGLRVVDCSPTPFEPMLIVRPLAMTVVASAPAPIEYVVPEKTAWLAPMDSVMPSAVIDNGLPAAPVTSALLLSMAIVVPGAMTCEGFTINICPFAQRSFETGGWETEQAVHQLSRSMVWW